MLDNTRLIAEITHLHRILAGVAASPRGHAMTDELRAAVGGGSSAALLRQALFADCLRVVHSAITADGHIGEDELEALYPFADTVARHYATVLAADYGEFIVIDHDGARRFLECYAADRGLFGHGSAKHWPGLALCRRAAELGERAALERYAALMAWLISAACRIGGITEHDPRWRGRMSELVELRRELAQGVQLPPSQVDSRIQAFLAPTRVFSSVQQADSVYDEDPYDVEAIHAEARDAFKLLVDRATTPGKGGDSGRILLVQGDSGAGKTHLLRGFRKYVHESCRGFVVYAQLHSASDDYSRYLLQHVVDSLSRPYTGPSGDRTGLRELAAGLPRLLGEPLRSQVAHRLTSEEWDDPIKLAEYINRLVDKLLVHPELSAHVDADLLRVLLYGLLPDPSIASRVYKYLRCENMNEHDRRRIGDVVPRTDKDDPYQMILKLARVAHITQHATLVLMVDQAERASFEASSGAAFQRAVNTLVGIVSQAPSAIAVVACLTDLYDQVRGQLTMSIVDRLQTDPPSQKLSINRSYAEIEAIVSRRLSWMFADAGAAYRPETPVYPIPEARLRSLVNRRTRDVLEWCNRFHAECALAGRIIDEEPHDIIADIPPRDDVDELAPIAAAWNDATHAPGLEVPDTDAELLELILGAARACGEELGLSVSSAPMRAALAYRIKLITGARQTELVMAITNKGYQRGAFITQLDELRRAAGKTGVPVAIRTLEYPAGASCDKAVAELLKAGGRKIYLDESTLRTLVALQQFRPEFAKEQVAAWRRRDRPISSLSAVAALLQLDELRPATPEAISPAPAPRPAAPDAGSGRTHRGSSPDVVHQVPRPATVPEKVVDGPRWLHLGNAAGLQAERCELDPAALFRPIAVLSCPGAGASGVAQSLIEQALDRDVAVVIIDSKGELAGYCRPEWWRGSAEPERARRLAERLDVRLFTPGRRGGRPLRLRAVPDLRQLTAQQRDLAAEQTSAALAALMGMGDATSTVARRALLATAVAVLSERPGKGTLGELITLLEERDDAMVARHGRYDERTLKRLVQDLQELRQSEPELFDASTEELSAETLLGRGVPGKAPLTILSTRFLGGAERAQAVTAYLIACLARHAAALPGAEPRALLVLDDAENYLPAGATKTPAKAPLQELLKRSHPQGLGVLLISETPEDFDLRRREQIGTWLLGKQPDRRMLDRLRQQVLEAQPDAATKLAALPPGHFVMLREGAATELVPAPSLLGARPLTEAEQVAMAARGGAHVRSAAS